MARVKASDDPSKPGKPQIAVSDKAKKIFEKDEKKAPEKGEKSKESK